MRRQWHRMWLRPRRPRSVVWIIYPGRRKCRESKLLSNWCVSPSQYLLIYTTSAFVGNSRIGWPHKPVATARRPAWRKWNMKSKSWQRKRKYFKTNATACRASTNLCWPKIKSSTQKQSNCDKNLPN